MALFNTATLTVGDTAYIGKPGSWDNTYMSGTVTKVTPTGQVAVELPSGTVWRFSNRGDMLGSASKWRVPFLVDKDTYDKAVSHQKQRAQAKAFERDVRELHAKLGGGYESFVTEAQRLIDVAKDHLK